MNHVSQLVAVVVVDGNNMAFTLDFLSDDGEDDGDDGDGVVGAYANGECDARNKLFNINDANNTQCKKGVDKPTSISQYNKPIQHSDDRVANDDWSDAANCRRRGWPNNDFIKTNQPIKRLSPNYIKSRIKSMEKKNILTCQLNEIGRCCVEISSKSPQAHLQEGAKKRETTIIGVINSYRP